MPRFDPPLNIAEEDGSPSAFPYKLKVTNGTLTDNADGTVSLAVGPTDHGALTGLADDDHTQYSLVAGTRAFTGVVGGITPTLTSHLATKGYVDTVASNISWREPVIDKDLTAPPGSPSTGDRYIVAGAGGTATGDWTGHENDIAEWSGAAWTFEDPSEGWSVFVTDEDLAYVYNGTMWVTFSAGTTDHGALTGLGDDDHTQYALLAGRSGGQTLKGSTLTAETLTLQANNVDTGKIVVGGSTSVVTGTLGFTAATANTGTLTHAATNTRTWTFPDETGTVVLNAFKTIAVSGQSDVVADSATDTLTLVAGSNVTITTDATTDTITIASSGGGGGGAVSSVNSLTGALTIAGTTNRVTVSSAGTTITLTTPQDTHTTATPQFARIGAGAAADATYVLLAQSNSSANGLRINGPAVNGNTQVIQFGTSGSTVAGQIRSTTSTFGGYVQILGADSSTGTQTVGLTVETNGWVALGTSNPSQEIHLQKHTLVQFDQTLADYAVLVKPTWNTGGVMTGLLVDTTDTSSSTASKPFSVQSGGSSLFNIFKTGTFEVFAGANATSGLGFQLLATWNNSGTNYAAYQMQITNTSSGGASKAFNILMGGGSFFHIYKQGTMEGYIGADAVSGLGYQQNFTWNNSGVDYVGINIEATNTASGANSRFYKGSLSGVTKFYVGKNGDGYFASNLTTEGQFWHTGSTAGFFSATPASKPTVTGSTGGNAALQSLAAALATLGLITNSTT